MNTQIKKLPPDLDIETRAVLKKVSSANRALAELKGIVKTIPNESILINTLALQEAKDSSEVENIVTTHDELFQLDSIGEHIKSPAAKEVASYVSALKMGMTIVKDHHILTSNHIVTIQGELEQNRAGFRKLPGTELKNASTGEVVYTPPQDEALIIDLMTNLEQFINDDSNSDLDPLVKMAVVHHQFESIHPFYDGNGRTGRIINVLYLVLKDLLDIPVLYLSRYIVRNKADYYRLLQEVRDTEQWEDWLLFMLDAVEVTSRDTIRLIDGIKALISEYKLKIRSEHGRIYSQELLNNLFRHPYTKIEFVESELGVTRKTASKYLDELVAAGLLIKEKIGKVNYYINSRLVDLLTDVSDMGKKT